MELSEHGLSTEGNKEEKATKILSHYYSDHLVIRSERHE